MRIDSTQPLGTPTWIDLGIPDLDRAMAFYGAVFGWDFEVGPEETGRYTMCRADGRAVAAIMPNPDPGATDFWWSVYLATDDCAGTEKRIEQAGGRLIQPTMDVMDQGRMAIAVDPVGAQFGLWEGRSFVGAELVNEPGTLLRNDLVTPRLGPARVLRNGLRLHPGLQPRPARARLHFPAPAGRARDRGDHGRSVYVLVPPGHALRGGGH